MPIIVFQKLLFYKVVHTGSLDNRNHQFQTQSIQLKRVVINITCTRLLFVACSYAWIRSRCENDEWNRTWTMKKKCTRPIVSNFDSSDRFHNLASVVMHKGMVGEQFYLSLSLPLYLFIYLSVSFPLSGFLENSDRVDLIGKNNSGIHTSKSHIGPRAFIACTHRDSR